MVDIEFGGVQHEPEQVFQALGAAGRGRPKLEHSLGFPDGGPPRAFGYEVRFFPLDRYLPALAYDAGANVLSAECFFRGVVFNHAHRRWPFGGAAALATGAFLVRHLVDPALPHAVETIVGATFYLTLLGVTSCALFRRSGSLLPGALAGLGFFAAYRALAGWW